MGLSPILSQNLRNLAQAIPYLPLVEEARAYAANMVAFLCKHLASRSEESLK